MAGLANGGWRNWMLGILATMIGSLVINGIVFQRETKEMLARHDEMLKRSIEREVNILKYLQERSDSLNRRIEELEKRR